MNAINLKILAGLIGLFGLGAASGYVVGKHTSVPAPAPPRRATVAPPGLRTNVSNRFFARWADQRITEYGQLLHLTPTQEIRIRSHFDALAVDFNSLKTEARSRISQALTRANTEIARDLTPEQRRLFWQHLRDKAKKAED